MNQRAQLGDDEVVDSEEERALQEIAERQPPSYDLFDSDAEEDLSSLA